MKYIQLLFAAYILFAIGCKSGNENTTPPIDPKKIQDSIAALGEMAKDSINEGLMKYDIKSGIINYAVDFGNNDTSHRQLVFDQFGARQIRISPYGITLDRDGFTYSINPADSVGTKMYTKNEDQFNPDLIDFKGMSNPIKEHLHYKELGEGKILGKNCKIVRLEDKALKISAKYWLYQYMPLKIEVNIMKSTSSFTAIDIQENIAVDPHYFDLPKKIKLVKVSN